MKGYGQFCPMAQAMEVLGERWTLLVVRELLCGSRRFNDLHRGVPRMSRSLLSQRLEALADAGVVERHRRGHGWEYELTEAGEELRGVVMACGEWGQRWVRRRVESRDVDVGLLMWDLRRNVDTAVLPGEPVVVQFGFRGAPRGSNRFWLLLRGPDQEVDLCVQHPGGDVDLWVEATPRALAEVWLGDVTLAAARRRGAVRLEGPRRLVRALPRWLRLSPFAAVERPAARRRG